jgi:hypothetical protein
MSDLLLIVRKNDLPPIWDGRRVEWGAWHSGGTTADLHVPLEPCEACRSTASAAVSGGIVHPLPGETFESERTKRSHRSGRAYTVRVDVPAWRVLRLFAFRCPSCGLDTVWDEELDEWWTLDGSDYGDDGSVAP